MVIRYPHTGIIKWNVAPAKDGDGDYTEGAESEETVSCRFESTSEKYTSEDGNTQLVYKYKVFMENQSFTIPNTSTITWEGNVYNVLKVRVYQNYTRLWV